MTGNQCKGSRINLQEIFGANKGGLKELLREVLQEVLEQKITDILGARKGERSPGRLGYHSGYYSRSLVTRVGKLELQFPQDRQGQFSTQIFERYQRSEKALVSALGLVKQLCTQFRYSSVFKVLTKFSESPARPLKQIAFVSHQKWATEHSMTWPDRGSEKNILLAVLPARFLINQIPGSPLEDQWHINQHPLTAVG